jgi:TolB-like protein/tetratricopeptide (TPR) repeat protein/predicted Ser/Thr protein kinase
MDLTGRTLAQYRVAEEISRGGMGVVYRATDTRLNRDVALKVLPDDLVNDAGRRRRFVQEAQAASAIEHPNIAVIYDVNEADGHTFIAMELIRGDKMSDWLARGRPATTRALDVAAEMASGLARAHDRQIVHRDLKPANVMLTEEGHAKVIDFGIAKLIEPTGESGLDTRTSHDTGAGVVLGTMTYMSPEQARGDRVDYRSDIFSFGIVLHEMLAGRPPFQGKSGIETASAILHEPAPRLPAFGPGVVADAGADIQRIVDKCLEKDPDERYQSMKDIAVDLRAARRRLETASQPAVVPPVTPSPRRTRWPFAAAAAGLAAVVGGGWVFTGRTQPGPASAAGSKPSVAVLYFDNTTGDESLDWMRTGITEMVVTDLSQSTKVEVVGTEHLYGILAELKRADDKVLSPEVIRAVAERTGVDNVVVGSFVRSGEALRINMRMQEAKTGRIVSSERVEGANASSLFAMVDDLSRRIRASFEDVRAGVGPIGSLLSPPGAAEDASLDRGLTDVTTPSIEAYQMFAEGMNQHLRFRERQAIPFFEKAVALDPGFASAYAKLAVIHNNLGRPDLRTKYGELALQHADRMTPRERLYTEGHLYVGRAETLARGMDAYQRCIDLYPGYEGCRHNLAVIQAPLGLIEESTRNLEEVIRRGGTFPATFAFLASNQLSLNQPEKALETAQVYSTRNPENSAGHGNVGNALLGLGRHREAAEAFGRAALLDPASAGARFGQVIALMLQDERDAARKVASGLAAGSQEDHRWFGAVALAVDSLLAGRATEARRFTERAGAAYERPVPRVATSLLLQTNVEQAIGRLPAALAVAERALAQAQGRADEGSAVLAVAPLRALAGRAADGEALLTAFAATASPPTARNVSRTVAQGRGALALVARDFPTAVRELTAAQSMLPPRPANPTGAGQHVPIWFALGEAHLGAGNAAEARGWFERIVNGPYERAVRPIEYVRSLYHLATIAEAAGDGARAVDYYRRFVGYWGDGEIDRDRVDTARRKLRQS